MGAFNIQVFGDKKMEDEFVKKSLIAIFTDFDQMVVQGSEMIPNIK